MRRISKHFQKSHETHFLRYAYYCLYATEGFRSDARQAALASEDLSIRRIAGFLDDLMKSAEQYTEYLAAFFKVKPIGVGRVPSLDARTLPLLRILRSSCFRDNDWKNWVAQAVKDLSKADSKVRDRYTIAWLQEEKRRM